MPSGPFTPAVNKLPDGTWSIDFGPPGPFIVLPEMRMRGLVNALAAAGWVRVNGKTARPQP